MGYANQAAQQHRSPATVIIQQPVQQRCLWVGNIKGHRDWTSGTCDCLEVSEYFCPLSVVIYALLYAADFSKVLFFCRIIMNLVRFLLEDE
jgi:hypothetical protein